MKIILAPDSFKDCLSGIDVCTILAEAARRELGDVEIRSFPMGDGGEGTLEAVLAATGGRRETLLVRDPLGRPVEAAYALLPNGEAFVEMAQASGLERLSRDERNPLLTSTYGTGQLISAALDAGCRKITVGIGGSATTDGGAGMAVALGARLVTADGRELDGRGGDLRKIARVDLDGLDKRLKECVFQVASDVTNPLCGDRGAAAVFGPQKGATPSMVAELDAGLSHWADLLAGGEANARERGDGAAGGLGFGLRMLCGATMLSGAALIVELTGLAAAMDGADLVVTGEGRTDEQTLCGKLPAVVATYAHAHGVRCVLISGALEGDVHALRSMFDACFGCVSKVCSLEEALRNARQSLSSVAESVFSLLKRG